MAVITFHSLESRIVKAAYRDAAGKNTPRDVYGQLISPPLGRIVGKPRAGDKLDPDNPRARSAHLRVFERGSSPGGLHASS